MSRKRRPGRPSKLTPETERRIVAAVRAGNYMDAAAGCAGIGTSTLYRWLAAADATDDIDDPTTLPPEERAYREFRDALLRARAEAEVRTVALVGKAVQGGYVVRRTSRSYRDAATGQVVTEVVEDVAPIDGKLGLEFLARAHPDRWGRAARSEVTVSGPDGGPVRTETTVVVALADRLVQLALERAEEGAEAPEDVVEGEIVGDES